MKKLYFTMTVLMFAIQSQAAIDIKKQESKLSTVLQLEQKQDYFGAVLTAAQGSSEILNQLRVDEIVASTNTQMTEIRNEVVTNKYKQSGGFSLLFGLLTGEAQRSWDSATIITANPEEVDGFSKKVSRDFRDVQGKLKAYVQQNETALAYAKAFALKTAQLATKLSVEDRRNLMPMIKTSIQFSQQLSFSGAQSITNCIETNYTNRDSSTSVGLGGLLLSFGLSDNQNQIAHTTRSCNSRVSSTDVNESVLISAKLSRLDMLISAYQKQLGLLEVAEAKAEPYQTWGLPASK